MNDCLAENDVVDLLDGRLGAADVERITTHLDACDACRTLVAAAAREAPGASPNAITRGACVGRYVVTSRIGVGAMGVVYAAYDPELDRRVALKLLRADAFATTARDPSELRMRLVREARALAQLSHPNVMTIHDVGTHEGEVFLAMEFVEGGTLADWLHAEPRSREEILERFRQAGEGLAAAHASGIVHRDFKPENVLIGKDGRTRVSDFGLAHASGEAPPVRDSVSDASPVSARATRTGALVGTPAYMAPEQWKGQPSDARTDVFAFSVALYEALYGERPFAATSADELAEAIAKNEVRPARGNVPAALRRVLLRGLRAEPDERYPSMRAMLEDLAPPPVRRPRIAIGVALGCAVIAGGFALRKPVPVCEAAGSDWGDAWDAHARADVKGALERANAPSAAFETIATTLDRYESAWIAMRKEACEATRVRNTQSEALLDARMRCLDERRRGARAYVHSVVTGPSSGLVERATTTVGNLPRVDDCGDVRALAAPMPLPSDPSKRARVEALGLRAAEIESEAANAQDALADLDPVEREASELGYPPLVARLAYDRAMTVSRLRDNRSAEIALQRAAVAGEAAHDDHIVMDAWTRLVFVVGYQEHRVEEGELWARYATAALERAGGDDRRQGVLDGDVGLMLLNDETRFDESRARFEQSLALVAKADGESSLTYARALGRFAMSLFIVGRAADSLPYERAARALYEKLLGPEGIDVALSLGNEGEGLLESGDIDGGIAMLERSAAMQERLGRNDSALLSVLGHAYRKKQDPTRALDVDRRALALAEKNEPEGAYELSFGNLGVALDLDDLARFSEALPYAERGAKLREITFSPFERGEARFALARALDATSPARAHDLATQARDDQSGTASRYGGRYAAALRETEAWLAAHPKK